MSDIKLANENNLVVEDHSSELYLVVRNEEEQYSIWPHYKKIPEGWEAVGEPKRKEECLDHIEKVWVDMRPLSLRKQMQK
jgi:MbtH protein